MTEQNVSTDEIAKFNKMAPEWWDVNGPMKPLHQINPLRTSFILDSLNKQNLDKLNILDIGCGGGILSESLAKLGATVMGIDMSGDAINVAKLHSAELRNSHSLDYINTSIEDFLAKHQTEHLEKYDVITCLELLEHVPQPEKMIANIKTLLKPGGALFVSTLNRNLKSYLLAIVGAEYVLNWIPRGTHEYSKFIKPSELAAILREHNFKINKIQGITYSIFSRDFNLSSDTDVNYIAHIN